MKMFIPIILLTALAAAGCTGTRSIHPLVEKPIRAAGFADGRWVLDARGMGADANPDDSERGRYVLDVRFDTRTKTYDVDAGDALGRFRLVVDRFPAVGERDALCGSLSLAQKTYDGVLGGLSPVEGTFVAPVYLNLKFAPTNNAYAVSLMWVEPDFSRLGGVTYTALSTRDLRDLAVAKGTNRVFSLYAILSPTNRTAAIGPLSPKENADLAKLKSDLAKDRAKQR